MEMIFYSVPECKKCSHKPIIADLAYLAVNGTIDVYRSHDGGGNWVRHEYE